MRSIQAIVLALLTLVLCGAAAAQTSHVNLDRVNLDIKSQPLRLALKDLGEQTGLQIMFRAEDIAKDDVTAPRISGELSAIEALEKMLARTKLQYRFVNPHTVLISADGVAAEKTALMELAPIRLAEADPPSNQGSQATTRHAGQDEERSRTEQRKIEEVVVTGSHIKGELVVPSNLIVISRDDIDRSGYGNISQLMASVPQNFGGGASQTTGNLTRDFSGYNTGLGSGVNLRGLGTGATLTLLNGSRLSPGGQGTFIDVSLIPLSAIDHIEILTDGASAIYGSDAIGGVVNIITRHDYQGAETTARVGGVTSGGRREYSLAQLLGHSWDRANVTLNLEHTDEDALTSSDKPFAVNGNGAHDLLPAQRWTSLISSVSVALSPDLRLLTDVQATDRQYDFKYFRQISPPENRGHVVGVALSSSLSLDFGDAWNLQVGGDYSRNVHRREVSDPLSSVHSRSKSTYDIWDAEVRATGPLFHLPAGDAKAAAGITFRSEKSDQQSTFGVPLYVATRDIRSAYAEMSLPLFGDRSDPRGSNLVDLSLAGRLDDYSDVGRTTNPRLGISWRPVPGIVARATYSRSFRAPLFFQTLSDPTQHDAYVFDVPDPKSTRPDGLTSTITYEGPNPDLTPERARSWTAGIDFRPEWKPTLSTSLNYFDINYRERILAIQSIDPIGFLNNEASFGSFITRNPSASLLTSILSPLTSVPFGINDFNTFQFGITDVNAILSQYAVGALFDARFQNAAESRLHGIDADVTYKPEHLVPGDLVLSLNASYLLSYSNRITATAPSRDLLNTAFNPIDLRLRGSVGWSNSLWSVSGAVNYADKYKDSGTTYTTGGSVSSWTTVGLQISYRPRDTYAPWLDGLTASLSATNLFDRNPPHITALTGQLAYDAENANPLGRFVSLVISEKW